METEGYSMYVNRVLKNEIRTAPVGGVIIRYYIREVGCIAKSSSFSSQRFDNSSPTL